MSVRRLAEPAFQPASFAFQGANAAWAKATIGKYPKGREHSAVIPLLMRAQEQEGWVTRAAIEHVADMIGMPHIRALEVATFYTQFQLEPVGKRAHVQVCGTTPCMLRGAEELKEVCRRKIHAEPHHTNEAGTLSWEEVECLGACVNAPMVMIFKDTYEDLTPERLEEIIDAFEVGKGASVPTGPQNGRVFSAPASGLTSLTDDKVILKRGGGKKTANKRGAGAQVPPSNAAKPKTDAVETNPTLKRPSRVKASKAGEQATSVATPPHAATQANRAARSVEAVSKQRSAPIAKHEPSTAYKAPERLTGEPIGAGGKRQAIGTPSLSDKNRPAAVERPQTPDDLRMISGVGPKIESILHSLGIYTYTQIASWKKAEREWVDGYLNFKGRIEREDWLRQAKALAKGGVEEYVRVFGKKPR